MLGTTHSTLAIQGNDGGEEDREGVGERGMTEGERGMTDRGKERERSWAYMITKEVKEKREGE